MSPGLDPLRGPGTLLGNQPNCTPSETDGLVGGGLLPVFWDALWDPDFWVLGPGCSLPWVDSARKLSTPLFYRGGNSGPEWSKSGLSVGIQSEQVGIDNARCVDVGVGRGGLRVLGEGFLEMVMFELSCKICWWKEVGFRDRGMQMSSFCGLHRTLHSFFCSRIN